MAEDNIFGIEERPSEPETGEETTLEAPEVEAPAEGSPAPEAAPEEAEAPADAPGDPVVEPAIALPTETVEEEEGEEDPIQAWLDSKPEGVQFAGKFNDPVELERGYNASQDMWRRANEARKAEAQRALELQERYAQLYQQMEGVVPVLEQAAQRERAYQAFAEQHKAQYGEYPTGYEAPAPQPALGPQDIDAQIEQRLAAERAQMQAQYQNQMEYQQLQGAIFKFYEEHPEVEPGGALDTEITDAKDYLNDAWDRQGIEVDTADPGSLNILYEASRDPALLEVLRLNPSYFESAYGMQLARRDAAVISGRVPSTTEPVTQTVPRSQVKATGQRKPFQESALVGNDAPEGEDPNDDWVRIKNADLGGRKPDERSVFFE
jgi:hypothetical protein